MSASFAFTPLKSLRFGFADAGEYRHGSDTALFHQFYLAHPQIGKLTESPCYFLVGDKGTGKTALATFYATWPTDSIIGHRLFVEKSDYISFRDMIERDKNKSLDYAEIWKAVILIITFSKKYKSCAERGFEINDKAKYLMEIIDNLSMHSFDDSVAAAVDLFAWDINSFLDALGQSGSSAPQRTMMRFIHSQFASALRVFESDSMTNILFIDGIDTRPFIDEERKSRIPGSDYLNCVRGLVQAVWSVNGLLRSGFGNKLRAVLLIRPDIIDRVGLQNLNSIMTDNSLLLNWYSTGNYRQSQLFQLVDNMLYQQQEEKIDNYKTGEIWDKYFPYDTIDQQERPVESFVALRRNTLHRPRDIITLLDLIVKYECRLGHGDALSVPTSSSWSSEVRKSYSDYLLGEVKEALSFYHETEEFQLFLSFFQYLAAENKAGHKFSYSQYEEAYKKYKLFIDRNVDNPPALFGKADTFLQFLYELNVISYRSQGHQRKTIWNYCIHDRSYANIRPKVQTHTEYRLHYGLARALHPVSIG